MAYWRLHYHLIWTTYRREPLIGADCEAVIHHTLFGKAKELGVLIHAIGTVEDHVHVVASIPPRVSVADCVGKLKGASSHRVNQDTASRAFRWQGGYGGLSLGARSAGHGDRLCAESTGASRSGATHRHLRTLHGGG
jgi:putative transposase